MKIRITNRIFKNLRNQIINEISSYKTINLRKIAT